MPLDHIRTILHFVLQGIVLAREKRCSDTYTYFAHKRYSSGRACLSDIMTKKLYLTALHKVQFIYSKAFIMQYIRLVGVKNEV